MVIDFPIRFFKTFSQRHMERKIKKNPNIQISRSTKILSYENIPCSSGKIEIGENTFINKQCAIVTINSTIKIGNNVLIGPATQINTLAHNFDRTDIPINAQGRNEKAIIIEDDIWIGAHCTILGGTKIGAHSVIGAHSLVKGEIPPYSVAYGVPAKVKRKRQKTRK